MQKHLSYTVSDLARMDSESFPRAFSSATHLIYSSPATLSFNSPGAEGFGVKRAALTLPNSVMLLFSPGCCGRNTSAVGGPDSNFGKRMFYLLLDETDIVTGRYLTKIVDACQEICETLQKKPDVLILCSTCVDALLGTDMERLCKKVYAQTGVATLAATMYALTREGHTPPMVAIRKTLYSLLKKSDKHADTATILGFFTHLEDSCELYTLLHSIGIHHIYELGRIKDMDEYQCMAHSNFTLVLHPEARLAAQHFAKELSIPSIEMTRSFEIAKIQKQYKALGAVLGHPLQDTVFREEAEDTLSSMQKDLKSMTFALGQTCNAEPISLAIALVRMGARVAEIFTDPSPAQKKQLALLAKLSPNTRISSNLSPSMLFYKPNTSEVTISIGRDACYYHNDCPGIPFCDDAQPFGYRGLIHLLAAIRNAL